MVAEIGPEIQHTWPHEMRAERGVLTLRKGQLRQSSRNPQNCTADNLCLLDLLDSQLAVKTGERRGENLGLENERMGRMGRGSRVSNSALHTNTLQRFPPAAVRLGAKSCSDQRSFCM